jgi:hypothetical protein
VRRRVATLVAVATLLVGCGGGVEGSPLAAERWDPCSITPEALAATGLDPSFQEGWGPGIEVRDWSLCIFRGPEAQPSYFFNVKSSDVFTVEDARDNETNLNGVDVEVDGRDAYRFTTANSRSITDCNVAVDVVNGVVVFTVNSMGTDPIGADPCGLAQAHTTDLAALLPPAK